MLSDGRWHSGEALAQACGVSRAAIWKRLQAMESWQLPLQAVQGRGYRLHPPIELLDAAVIRSALTRQTRSSELRLDVIPVLDSTNAWLMGKADEGVPHACLAEYQTAGRGRRGRAWISPFGANLYLSLAWRFSETPAQPGALSLAVGVALAERLATLGAAGVGVKWPNDLLWRQRKLAGILIEQRGEAAGPARVVIGVGVNYAMTEQQGGGIEQPWTSLQAVMNANGPAAPGRNALAAGLIEALLCALEEFSQSGFAGFTQRWRALDVAYGKEVRLDHDGRVVRGCAVGVDRDGALLLAIAGRRERFLSGDLSLRVEERAP